MQDISHQVNCHAAFFGTGVTKQLSYRLEVLKKLQSAIHAHEAEICDALRQDLSKSDFEAYETEIGLVYEELRRTIRCLPKWARDKHVKTPIMHFHASSRISPEPYGTVLIMSPWNYPFQLTMIPLIGAVAAGNCCVLKPSEYASHTAEVMETIVREVFDSGHVSLVRGGRSANQSLLSNRFDYIFFTGSPTVGHVVMESAAKYLTPITLELGGKSPCIVDETADIPVAAARIVWGKLLNAGQTCIAPDYLLVQESCKDRLVEEMKKAVVRFYGEHPEQADFYPKIINEKHYQRLLGLLDSGTILFGGEQNPKSLKIAPTLLEPESPDCPIMEQEIFGPIMPILTFHSMDEVYALVGSRPKPLALYLFSRNEETIKTTMDTLSFGGGCINDTITHIANPNLPFGGVGNSGMGQYHSKRTFDTFTHYKSILRKSNFPDIPLRYPPCRKHLGLLKKILK